MIEVEYTTTIEGRKFAVYYDGTGLGWHAWLEGTGTVGTDMNADGCLAWANKRMGTDIPYTQLTRHEMYTPAVVA